MSSRDRHEEDGPDFVVPFEIIDERLGDATDTEQHKARRGTTLQRRSIKNYRHATTKWGAALENFVPMWFAICISSGGLALVLNGPFPYRARWLIVCSTILYFVDIVTFVLFGIIMVARWIMYPHVAIRRALHDPDELGAYAIPPIAVMTIASLTASQASEADWAAKSGEAFNFTLLAYSLWWIGLIWVFITAVVVLTVLFYTGNQSDRIMTPILFMAPVGMATAGSEAGTISIYAADISARLAVPQIVVGYFAVGVALFMAIMLYTIYLHRLLSSGWAPAAKRAGVFILIGPCGQLSTALQLLGESANHYMRFAEYKPAGVHPPSIGTFWTQKTAQGLDGAGLLLALLLLGFGYFMFAIAIVGVVDAFVKRNFSYTLTWWAIVFPSVTITTAFLNLASSMNSPAFRGLTCAMTVFITVTYFVNWGYTVKGLLTGDLLFGQSQLESEEETAKQAEKSKANGTNGTA